jgi:hypothetical protein
MANASQPPGVLLCASAVGFYGADRGDDVLTEESGSGEGFLAEVCRLWESATLPAEKSGARVVHLRFGMVLSGKGGALPKMLPIFNAGLGGPLGSGAQWLSWVALEDAAGAILFCLERSEISGPVNVTAPQPVTNREFSETLAEVLDKPCRMRAPAFALKLLMGQMAAETVLASQRVKPVKLLEQEYVYACPELRSALERATASA